MFHGEVTIFLPPFLPLKSPFSILKVTIFVVSITIFPAIHRDPPRSRAPQGRAGDVGVGAHDFGRQGPDQNMERSKMISGPTP